MLKRARSILSRCLKGVGGTPSTSRLGVRAAVVAAGLGTTAALGAGVASAADGPATAQTAVVQGHAAVHGKADSDHGADSDHRADSEHRAEKGEKRGEDSHAGGHEGARKASAHGGHHRDGTQGDHHHKAHGAHHKAHGAHHDQKAAAHHPAHTWSKPVHKYHLTASFDQAGGMWSHKHSGQDFAVPIGTPVGAAHGGVVVKAGPNGGGDGPAYGNAIVISHGNGTYSQYAHLSQIDVHVGEQVKKDERIALSGNTGNTSGPHLHFEIRSTPDYGSAIDPVTFLDHHGLDV